MTEADEVAEAIYNAEIEKFPITLNQAIDLVNSQMVNQSMTEREAVVWALMDLNGEIR